MPINYNLGRQPAPQRTGYQAPPPVNRYALTRQAPLSQNAQLADNQNLQGLKTGQFADVESARGATDRANALRSASGLQAARGTVARAGGEVSPEAALRAQDQAFASAEAQNLNASNGVNQLQRQYRQDAINQSGAIESRDQTNANNERAYQTNRDDEQYSRFGLERANTQQQQQQAVTNNQWDKSFGANREDAATAKDEFGQTLQNQKDQFGVTAGQNQQQITNQKDQFGQSLSDSRSRFDLSRADSNSQFDQTFGANREDAATQKDQFGQTLDQRDKEFGVTSGQNQQQITNQKDQFGQTYAANREDAGTAKDQFGQTLQTNKDQFAVTSGQSQQQIENQAAQAAQRLGYDYASLSQTDKEFLMKQVQEQGQFDVTSGQNQQQINNQVSQYGQTAADSRSRFDLSRADANTQFDKTFDAGRADVNYDRTNANRLETKGDSLAEINAIQDPKAKQAAYNAYMNGEDVSQFITGTLYGDKGDLNKDYASASPAQQEIESQVDKLKSITPHEPGETSAEFDTRVRNMATQKAGADYQVSNGVAQDAALDRTVSQKMSTGTQLSDDEKAYAVRKGLVNTYTAATLPTNADANALKGQQVNVDGQVYTVVGGSNAITGKTKWGLDTHTDYTILDKGGTKVYMVNGKIQSTEPKDS